MVLTGRIGHWGTGSKSMKLLSLPTLRSVGLAPVCCSRLCPAWSVSMVGGSSASHNVTMEACDVQWDAEEIGLRSHAQCRRKCDTIPGEMQAEFDVGRHG